MSIRVIPEMDSNDLEKILEVLPKPNSAEFYLFGEFDYSSIEKQAADILPGIKFHGYGTKFQMQEPTKEKILEIYKKFHEWEDKIKTNSNRKSINDEKRMQLDNIEWYLDGHVTIKLTPTQVSVFYRGKEPVYVTFLRNVLVYTGIRLKIENDNSKYGQD